MTEQTKKCPTCGVNLTYDWVLFTWRCGECNREASMRNSLTNCFSCHKCGMLDHASDQHECKREKVDGHVHTMPTSGPEHIQSQDCWCHPDIVSDYTFEGGRKQYLHKEIQ